MILANANLKEVQIEAVVIRANGTVERLGTVSYWHRNPLIRWFKNVFIRH